MPYSNKLVCVSLQTGNQEDIAKYSKRTIRVTQQHNDECKRLLNLMGVPVINVSQLVLTCNGLVLSQQGSVSVTCGFRAGLLSSQTSMGLCC